MDRQISLRVQGDWGQANLHRISCALSHELVFATSPGTEVWIRNGRGAGDAVDAVLQGTVDAAWMTPAWTARAAVEGVGPFAGRPAPELRALGVMPQHDRLVVGVRRETGLTSWEDLAAAPGLRITTSPDDGVNLIGYTAHRLLAAGGVDLRRVKLLEYEWPFPCLEAVLAGEADVIVHEAIMTTPWQDLGADLLFLDAPEAALDELGRGVGDVSATVRAGYFPGLECDLRTLDFSDFVLLAHADMADDVAQLVSTKLIDSSEWLERQYSHIPPERSPLTYPLIPSDIATTPIAAHPGSEAAFHALGLR